MDRKEPSQPHTDAIFTNLHRPTFLKCGGADFAFLFFRNFKPFIIESQII